MDIVARKQERFYGISTIEIAVLCGYTIFWVISVQKLFKF